MTPTSAPLCEKEWPFSSLEHMYINHPYLLGVGVFPSQDPAQPRMPPWIYNESLVPGKVKLLCPAFPSGYFTLNIIEVFLNTHCHKICRRICYNFFLREDRKLNKTSCLRLFYRLGMVNAFTFSA